MLKYLFVKNLALIKDAEIHFDNGLNILSGETGAGKSILLNSILLALGKRADKEMIREGADFAFVELEFSVSPDISEKLKQLDIFPEHSEIIIQRKLQEGKSVAKINGETVNTKLLSEVSEILLQVHGQRELDTLLDERNHRSVLDTFGGKEFQDLLGNYEKAYGAYRKRYDETKNLFLKTTEELSEDWEYLSYAVSEIEGANLEIGEEEKLKERFSFESHREALLSGLLKAKAILSDETLESLGNAEAEIRNLISLEEKTKEISEPLQDAENLLRDALREAESKISELEFDEERFSKLNERLDLIRDLKRKYGDSEEKILKRLSEMQEEKNQIEDLLKNRDQISEELEILKGDLINSGDRLHEKRMELAKSFSEKMENALSELNFLQAVFETRVEKTKHYRPEGCDDVEFYLSANVGAEPRPLKDVASGGELSRIMLSIKTVIAESDAIPTLVFDEIDTGISGVTASKVADKLSELSKKHQVICISHLPQIVAHADHHFLISKSIVEGETVTRVQALTEGETLVELSRLLGNGETTEATLENARELRESSRRKF